MARFETTTCRIDGCDNVVNYNPRTHGLPLIDCSECTERLHLASVIKRTKARMRTSPLESFDSFKKSDIRYLTRAAEVELKRLRKEFRNRSTLASSVKHPEDG